MYTRSNFIQTDPLFSSLSSSTHLLALPLPPPPTHYQPCQSNPGCLSIHPSTFSFISIQHQSCFPSTPHNSSSTLPHTHTHSAEMLCPSSITLPLETLPGGGRAYQLMEDPCVLPNQVPDHKVKTLLSLVLEDETSLPHTHTHSR